MTRALYVQNPAKPKYLNIRTLGAKPLMPEYEIVSVQLLQYNFYKELYIIQIILIRETIIE